MHTPEEAAKIIGGTCKASWLKAGARAGTFPHVMIGGAYNFTDEQIREIVGLCTVPARRPPAATAAPATAKSSAATPTGEAARATGVTPLRARPPRQRNR